MNILEICVDTFASAEIAVVNGADRLELCRDLSVGGVTPNRGVYSLVKVVSAAPVFALIRPRSGNFHYDGDEVEKMIKDIHTLKSDGVNGFVFGALTEKKEVDISVCRQLLDAAGSCPVTFHRAFDEVIDKEAALETIIGLGFSRVLTTGGADTAFEGIQDLKNLISQANNRIKIMPGGGINDENISAIMNGTNATEFHASGRKSKADSSYKSRICCPLMIYKMCQIINPGVTPRSNIVVHT